MSDTKHPPLRVLDILAVVSLTAALYQLLRTHSFGADYYRQFIVTESRILCFAISLALGIWSVYRHVLERQKRTNLASRLGVCLSFITLTLLLGAILVGWVFPQHPRIITIVFGATSVLATGIAGLEIWTNGRTPPYIHIFLVLFLFAVAHLTIQLLAVPGGQWFNDVFEFTYPFAWIFELVILAVFFLVLWFGQKPNRGVSHLMGVMSAAILLLINPLGHLYLYILLNIPKIS